MKKSKAEEAIDRALAKRGIVHVGVDLARVGSDRTVIYIIGRRAGKETAMRRASEREVKGEVLDEIIPQLPAPKEEK